MDLDNGDEALLTLLDQEQEFIDRTRTFKGIETIEDIFGLLDDYQYSIFPELVTEESRFVFNLVYIIDGNYRTLHLDGLTLEGFRTELLNFDRKIETYKEREEDLFERFVELRIRQRNRAYGRGEEMYLTTIEDDQIYFKCFTKTTKRCITISAIKFQEKELRTKTATELESHPLLQRIKKKEIFCQEEIINEIERYYKKKVVIIQPTTEINYDQKINKIILIVYNNHVGYVTKDYPTIEFNSINKNKNNESKEKDKEKEPKEKEKEHLQALFFWDLEFEWEKKESTYVSKEPNLVCMKGLIKTQSGYEVKTFVKRNIGLMMAVLINMANKGKVLVYSVNGAKIEHQQALREIIKNYFKNKKHEYTLRNTIGSKIKTLKFGENLYFYDTVLLLPMSLSEMATNFNTTTEKGHKEWGSLPKTLKVWKEDQWVYEFDKDEWYRTKKWDYKNKDDIDYCVNDCDITMDAMMAYNNNLKDKVDCISYLAPNGDTWVLGNTSISSIGKQTLLRRFPDGLNCNAIKSILQESYMGGRCEIFYHGYLLNNESRTLVSIDINSSYPFQGTKDLPYSIYSVSEEIPKFSNEYIWGSYCWISYKENYQIPPLGIKRGGNLYFPNLDEPTLVFLWDFEYYHLQDNLIIHQVSKTFNFTKTTFKPLFESWYELKKNAPNKTVKTVAKQLLNGTTGGLGLKQLQPVRVLTKSVEMTMEDLCLQKTLSYEAFDGYEWLIYNDFIVAKTMFQAISYITALGRWQLWEKCIECKRIDPQCKILRLDTDGLTVFANEDLNKHLQETSNDELGGWDYETHTSAYVRGLKKYALDDKVVFNGINSKLKEKLSMMHLTNEFLITDNEKWLQKRDLGWENRIRAIKMSKEYDKGKILENGDVEPLLYSEIKSLKLPIEVNNEFLLQH